MSWIDDRLADRNALRARETLIKEHAISIYEALWNKLVEHIEDAKTKSFDLFTNGALQNRKVILWKKELSGEYAKTSEELTFRLDGKVIFARSANGLDLSFYLDVCPDGVVCLKTTGDKQISIEEASIAILDLFLFPDLPPLLPPH
jgi:hypothetical protein